MSKNVYSWLMAEERAEWLCYIALLRSNNFVRATWEPRWKQGKDKRKYVSRAA